MSAILRGVSWMLAVFAYAVPPSLLFLARATADTSATGQYRCGLPLVAMMILALLGVIGVSGVAVLCGCVSYYNVPKPRPRARLIELGLVSGPIVVWLSLLAFLISIFGR